MKKLLNTLAITTVIITTNICTTSASESKITLSTQKSNNWNKVSKNKHLQQLKSETKKSFLNNHSDKQQDTIYIDKNGKQRSTNQDNLFGIDTTEIIQIGFFENQKKRFKL